MGTTTKATGDHATARPRRKRKEKAIPVYSVKTLRDGQWAWAVWRSLEENEELGELAFKWFDYVDPFAHGCCNSRKAAVAAALSVAPTAQELAKSARHSAWTCHYTTSTRDEGKLLGATLAAQLEAHPYLLDVARMGDPWALLGEFNARLGTKYERSHQVHQAAFEYVTRLVAVSDSERDEASKAVRTRQLHERSVSTLRLVGGALGLHELSGGSVAEVFALYEKGGVLGVLDAAHRWGDSNVYQFTPPPRGERQLEGVPAEVIDLAAARQRRATQESRP